MSSAVVPYETKDPERRWPGDSPMHGAIDAHGADQAARQQVRNLAEERSADETAKTNPAKAQDHRRRADEHRERARDAKTAAGKSRDAASRARCSRDELSPARRGRMRDWREVVLAGLVCLGADVCVLDLSLLLTPGTATEHWVTAGFMSLGIGVFTTLAGWATARIWEALPAKAKLPVAAGTFGLLMALFIWAIFALSSFRGESLSKLQAGNLTPVNPGFFGPMQLMLAASATLAAFRFYLGEWGRELLFRTRRFEQRADDDEVLSEQFEGAASEELTAAQGLMVEAMRALVALPFIRAQGKAKLLSIGAHTRFVKRWFDTMFLRKRYQAKVPPVSVEQLAEEHEFRLNRVRQWAPVLLALCSLVVSVTALALGEPLVAVIALVASIAHAALAVWLRSRPSEATVFARAARSHVTRNGDVPESMRGEVVP